MIIATKSSARTYDKATRARKPGVRELAAQATRDKILASATKVFAKHGYDGGSIEKISQAADTYDRMIYYYFGSKEGLFIQVLEGVYRTINEAEAKLNLDPGHPVESLKAVIRFRHRYYQKHPEFITLLNTENLHKGKHLSKSPQAQQFSSTAVARLDALLENGREQGLFRDDITARDLYLLIASMGYFCQSNRYTLSAFLGENLDRPEAIAAWDDFMIDSVLRVVAIAAGARSMA